MLSIQYNEYPLSRFKLSEIGVQHPDIHTELEGNKVIVIKRIRR